MSEQVRPLTQSMPNVDHWQDCYNWLTVEQELNDFGQFMTTIDGVDII